RRGQAQRRTATAAAWEASRWRLTEAEVASQQARARARVEAQAHEAAWAVTDPGTDEDELLADLTQRFRSGEVPAHAWVQVQEARDQAFQARAQDFRSALHARVEAGRGEHEEAPPDQPASRHE